MAKVSNPIKKTGLVAKINALNSKISNKSSESTYTEKPSTAINYPEFIKLLSEIISTKKNTHDLFFACHKLFRSKLNNVYTSIGIINKKSNCINIKLADKIGSIFSSRVFLNEESNEIVNAISENKVSIHENNDFLKIPYLASTPSVIIPMASFGDMIGVMIIGDYQMDSRIELYTLVANYFGLYINNFDLKDKASQNAFIDNLTGLYSHRHFQEVLANELKDAQTKNSPVSVVLFEML